MTPEAGGSVRRVALWVGWGALAALGYAIALPLMLGGIALVPIAIVAFEEGPIEAAISLAAGVLGVAILGQALSIPAVLVFGSGAILGLTLRRGDEIGRGALATAGVAILALIGYFALPPFLGGNRLQITPQDVHLFSQAFGLSGGDLQSIKSQMLQVLPGVVPLYGGLVALEGIYFSRWALAMRRHELAELRPFALWEAPAWLPPLYLALLATQLALSLTGAGLDAQRFASFGVLWAEAPLAVIGLSILNFWLLRMRLPRLMRVLMLGLMLLMPVFSQILVWVGILDGLADLRHIHHSDST